MDAYVTKLLLQNTFDLCFVFVTYLIGNFFLQLRIITNCLYSYKLMMFQKNIHLYSYIVVYIHNVIDLLRSVAKYTVGVLNKIVKICSGTQ